MRIVIGIDGLIEIARRNGMISYSVAVGPGTSGLEGVAVLRFENEDKEFRATTADAIAAGVGTSKVWEKYPYRMMGNFVLGQAIRNRFSDEIAKIENEQ